MALLAFRQSGDLDHGRSGSGFQRNRSHSQRRQGDEVSLRVTADELVTQGNMGELFQTEQQIATKDVLGMSYRHGGERMVFM